LDHLAVWELNIFQLGSPEVMEDLLTESDYVAQQRREITLMLQAYSKAEDLLKQVRDESSAF